MEYLTTTIPTHFEIERTRLADVILTKLSDDKAVKLAKQMLDEHEYIESLLVNTDPSVDDVKELANSLYDLGGWVISYIVNIIGGNLNISSPIDGVVTKGFFAEHIETALGKLRFIRCFLSP